MMAFWLSDCYNYIKNYLLTTMGDFDEIDTPPSYMLPTHSTFLTQRELEPVEFQTLQ